ncbi:MAG: zinc ribbon domain-containing protein [Bacteroidetes bacterium]|nr:zinc ribbon domain-containing protein [Bacteroidota bacterium]
MKFCPTCRTEYTDAALFCAECNILLVEQLTQPAAMDQCDNCSGEMDLDNDYCPHCGTLYAEDQYSCSNHPTGVATGVCVICQQLFCTECLNEKNGRLYCDAHISVESTQGWSVVFTSSDFYEAEIIRGSLQSAGFTTHSANTTNIGVMADGFMDNALGRTIFKYPIKIFVPADQYLAAQEFLAQDHTGDSPSA